MKLHLPARRVTRGLVIAGICAVVFVGVLWARALVESRAELASARRAESADELEAAIESHRRALRWAAPFNPYAAESLDALLGIAERAEAAKQPKLALAAYRAARSGLRAGEGALRGQQPMERIGGDIARIAVRLRRLGDGTAAPGATGAAELRAQLTRQAPRGPYVLLALTGFVLWVGGTFVFAGWGFEPTGPMRRTIAVPTGVAVVLGLAGFAAGLWAA